MKKRCMDDLECRFWHCSWYHVAGFLERCGLTQTWLVWKIRCIAGRIYMWRKENKIGERNGV